MEGDRKEVMAMMAILWAVYSTLYRALVLGL